MEDSFGPWRTIGPKWVLRLDILQLLLISIRVQHTFLLVILVFPQYFIVVVVFLSIYGHYDSFLSGILFCWGFYHLVSLWALRMLSACHFVLVRHKTDVVPSF